MFRTTEDGDPPGSTSGADRAARFGTVIGIAPGRVPAYSSDYASADDGELPDRHAYRSYVDGIYMGEKWQCVEFARRWMYLNRGCIFDDVTMAHEVFELDSVRDVANDRRLPLKSFRNGSLRHPEVGCMLVWDEGGMFERTGHVAIVTEVLEDRVRLVEQNVDNRAWPSGRAFSRELRARVSAAGEYWIECSFGDATILGWVIQSDDGTDAVAVERPDPALFAVAAREVPDRGQAGRAWLNVANPDEAAYVEAMGGHLLGSAPGDAHRYYCISETALAELERATVQLHGLFMHATDYVLRDDALLARFDIPLPLWPKIHRSWNNRRNRMITGRFDFALSPRGLKVYEYNCDSASCHMECGRVQGRWAQHFGCRAGRDPGADLHAHLRDAWRRTGIGDLVHIMQDRDDEESYHALFMQRAMTRAGIATRIIRGVEGLGWGRDGRVLDPDGEPIRWVWKTWAWETALDQLRAELEEGGDTPARRDRAPRLVDVLLRDEVMVFEPLWTLVPSNKAILPVLWSLFPNHRFLLDTACELGDELRAKGFVAKPIVGRCGSNISIVDPSDRLLAETGGRFDDRDLVYQQLWPLPRAGGYNVQLCTFTAGGAYAGSCVRADPTLVISKDSDTIALRVVEDEELLELARGSGRPAPSGAGPGP